MNLKLRIKVALLFSTFSAFTVIQSVSAQTFHPRIIDGTRAPVAQFPYVANLSLGDFICTGTLVGNKYVLTAAHCFFDEKNHLITNISQFGATLNGTFYKAAKVTVNPTYVSRSSACVENERDSAVMELQSAPPGIDPIPLQRSVPTVGTQLLLVGFGTQGTGSSGENDTFPPDGFVNYATTKIETVDNSYVNWIFNANNGEGNTAGGDSGGPAFVDVNGTRLINSITCGGTGNAGFNTDSSNTRADLIADWVDAVVGSTPANTAPSFIRLAAQTVGVNQPFSYIVQATGTAPLSIAVGGDLPAGLTFDGSNISGTPTVVGNYTIPLTVTNAIGSASGSLVIHVTAFNPDSALSVDNITISFDDENADLVAIRGKITLGSHFSPKNSVVKVTLAALANSFKLDAKGNATRKGGFDSVKLIGKLSKGKFTQSRVQFRIGLGDKNSLFDKLDRIFPETAVNGDTALLPVQIMVKGVSYDKTVTMKYNENRDIWVNTKD